MSTSETLNKAADLIQEHGWAKGPKAWRNPDGEGLCIEGAIYAALGATGLRARVFHNCPAYDAMLRYLGLKDDWFGMWLWNDTKAGSAETVIGALRACAVIEEAKEKAETYELVAA